MPKNKQEHTTLSALAIIEKVQTTIDGGTRVSLDFSANETELAKFLLHTKLTQGKIIAAFQRVEEKESPTINMEKIDV